MTEHTTITLPRSVVEQALEDLEMTINYVQSPIRREDMRDSIETLRAALEPQDHPEQILNTVPNGWKLVPVEPTPEMMSAMIDNVSLVNFERGARNGYRAMLAAALEPPVVGQPQPPRQPLTDEEINNMDVWLRDIPFWRVLKLSRAIERAHGIGGEK